MARFATSHHLVPRVRGSLLAPSSVPARHVAQVQLAVPPKSTPSNVQLNVQSNASIPSAGISTTSPASNFLPSAEIPKYLSRADVFGARPSRHDEQTISQDCKSRVNDAIRSGRDPLDAGHIWPTNDSALGSYYLFYSGVSKALPKLKAPPTLNARTQVVDIPGQGKGVVANRAFQPGELVVAERPLLVLPSVDMSLSAQLGASAGTVTMRNWCLSSLVQNTMKANDLDAISSLHNAHSCDSHDFAGIFNTNALAIPSLPGHDAPYGALCVHLARINHSCTPNAYWRWDLSTFSIHLYAARPIAEGEQISIHYVPLLQTHAARHDQLLDRYIFRCTCAACRAPRAERIARDARRASLKHFVDTPLVNGPLTLEASRAVINAVRTARLEEYHFADVWSPVLCYAARAAIALGEADAAASYARRAAKLADIVTGQDGGWGAVADAPTHTAGWRAMVDERAGLREVLDVLGMVPF